MTEAVATRLAAILATVALGWIAARAGWLGRSGQGRDQLVVAAGVQR